MTSEIKNSFFIQLLASMMLIYFVSPVVLSAQQAQAQLGTLQQHPKPEFYPFSPNEALHFDLHNKSKKPKNAAFQRLIDQLNDAILADSIGVLEGVDEEVFGRIEDIEADAEGNIYILDSEFSEVRVFNNDFSFLTAIGSAGFGPGEFKTPFFVALDEESNVYVMDQYAKVSRFNKTQTNYVFDSRFTETSFFKEGLLVINGRYYFRGSNSESINGSRNSIKAYSTSTRENVFFFGRAYTKGGALVQNLFSGQGQLEQVGKNIISSGQFLPFIESFNLRGESNWVIQLDNFGQYTVNSYGAGGFSAIRPSGEDTWISSITNFDDMFFVLQIKSYSPDKYQTWLIDAESGEGYFVSDKLPKIYEITENGFYAKASTDYPRADFYKFND